MPGSARKFTATGVDRGRSLAAFLAERLEVPFEVAVELVRAGAIYVERRRTQDPEQALQAGQRITAHVDQIAPRIESAPGPAGAALNHRSVAPSGARAAPDSDQPGGGGQALDRLQVRYRDRGALVVEKPAGIPTQATRTTALGTLDRLVQELDPEARLVHRLDREASGLVLFSRSAAARRRFARLLAERALVRIYTAVVWGHVASDEAHLVAPIGPDPQDRRRMAAGLGRPAETHLRVIRRGVTLAGHPLTLVELTLVTGRTHQIRVHMAHGGHPLCGDARYGRVSPPFGEPVERLCLHATELGWPGVRVRSPAPPLFDGLVQP